MVYSRTAGLLGAQSRESEGSVGVAELGKQACPVFTASQAKAGPPTSTESKDPGATGKMVYTDSWRPPQIFLDSLDSGTEQMLERKEPQKGQGWACFPSFQGERITVQMKIA